MHCWHILFLVHSIILKVCYTRCFSAAAIVKKIRHLRTQYTRELAKAKKVGSQYFQSKWPYFEILDSFLRNHIQSRFLPSPEVK